MLKYLNMDLVTESIMASVIGASRFKSHDSWQPGKKLRMLLVGYNGARNTGADVRVEGMVKQFQHIFGMENFHCGIMTLDAQHSAVYYKPPVELIQFSSVFFKDLLRACSNYHMAVLSEGSCFKSKFANALTTFFFGAAGIMKKQKKPCIAYGSEAGDMDKALRWFVKRYCNEAYVISRTEPSSKVVQDLGLSGSIGTDTAWTFMPGPEAWAVNELKKHGWDGVKPILGLAVINPFYWPVKPSLAKFIGMKVKRQVRPDNYDKWYFFSTSEERTRMFDAYINAIAYAADAFVEKHDAFPVIIGMERLDLGPNRELQRRMKTPAPIFCSESFNGYEMTSILWKLSMLITSRYHARVLSMTGGVPSGAVSMDERLENLLTETGHINDYYLRTDDPELGEKLPPLMERLWENREKVREDVLRTVPGYLRKMAVMGREIKDFVRGRFSGIELPPDPEDIMGYLPPLDPPLARIMEKYA